MRIPERVKIGPYTYRVVHVDGLRDDKDRNQELYGHIKYGEQTINIDTGITDDRKHVCFWHEVLHGLDELAGAGMKEKQVTRLAPLLWQFLVDNDLLKTEPAKKKAA